MRLTRILPLLLLIAAVAGVFLSGAGDYLSLESLKAHEAQLRGYVAANLVLALLVYVGVYAAATAVSIPGALFLTLAGGFLFGPWIGGSATVVGATLGACGVFLIVKTSLGSALRARAEAAGGTLKSVMDGVREGAFGYILTLRLIPLAPFWLVNVAAALADAPFRAYALATLFGIMPATFIFSIVGSGISEVLARGATPDLNILREPYVLGPLVALGLLSLTTTIFQRVRKGRAK
jgi:uncharacterized membrane protein YdjX (TVP38/TMEM64 family)